MYMWFLMILSEREGRHGRVVVSVVGLKLELSTSDIFLHTIAMPFEKKRIADIGIVESFGDKYRVHVRYRDEAGEAQDIYGPLRSVEQRAKEDLMAMRAAGEAAENVSGWAKGSL